MYEHSDKKCKGVPRSMSGENIGGAASNREENFGEPFAPPPLPWKRNPAPINMYIMNSTCYGLHVVPIVLAR